MASEQPQQTRPRLACRESPRKNDIEELQEMANKILTKVEEIHSDRTKSPRSKIESRTDAAVNNTQLVLKHLEDLERKMEERDEKTRITISGLVKEILLAKLDIENLKMALEDMEGDDGED